MSGVFGERFLEKIQQTDWYKKYAQDINKLEQSNLEDDFTYVLRDKDKELNYLITCY